MSVDVRRVAVLNPYKGVAESESAARIKIAAERKGIEVAEFYLSSEINAFDPDFVIALSYQDAKLTKHPTYGVMTAPTSLYVESSRFMRNILSYDAYFTVSPSVKRWLEDIAFGARKLSAPVGFYANTVQRTEQGLAAQGGGRDLRLAYFGTNWDGQRFGPLFSQLSQHGFIDFYGPKENWAHVNPQAVRGAVPFDGKSVLDVYRKCGVGLSIVRPDFHNDDLPSNRIFEIAAAGAVIVSSRSRFVEHFFGDSVYYIDQDARPEVLHQQIVHTMAEIQRDPAAALRKADTAHRIFNERLSLDRLLDNMLDLHRELRPRRGYAPAHLNPVLKRLPSVGYIVRAGGRPVWLLHRALQSLREQNYGPLTVILVLWQEPIGLGPLLEDFPDLNIVITPTQKGMRSRALWDGLAKVKELGLEYFGILDDDDELFPNHVQSLMATLQQRGALSHPTHPRFAYSANVERSKSTEFPEKIRDGFNLAREDTVRIEHFPFFSRTHASRSEFFIMSNSFLAASELLDEEIMQDPQYHIGEDYYLINQLMERSDFTFSCEVSCAHNYHGHEQSGFDGSKEGAVNHRRTFFRSFGRRTVEDRNYTTSRDGDAYEEHNFKTFCLFPQRYKLEYLTQDFVEQLVLAEGSSRTGSVITVGPSRGDGRPAVYGPYVTLPSGAYDIVWFIRIKNAKAGVQTSTLVFDVARDGGEVFLRQPRTYERGERTWMDVRMQFSLPAPCAHVEFRIWNLDDLEFEIHGVLCRELRMPYDMGVFPQLASGTGRHGR